MNKIIMKQCVIGIDIGTGSAKAVAIDNKEKILSTSQVYYETQSPSPGYSEQEPEIIWMAFVKCIHEIIKKLPHVPVSVSLSSAMHSLVVMDSNNKAITPLITWADTRSENIAEEIRNSAKGEKIYQATGTPIHSMSPLCKIKWIKENESAIFSKAFKFISIKEFIWYRLFDKYEIDFSIASATGLFNIENLQWNKPSLDLCGIKLPALSKPVSTSFARKGLNKSIAGVLKIPADTTFCIGASDGCLANIGSNAIRRGVAALTIGTSGAVRIACNKPLVNYDAMLFNYILDEKTFISGGPVNNGGDVVEWLFTSFLNNKYPSKKDYSNFFKLVEKIPAGCNGLVFLPYIYGERAPVWDEKASGIFFGIKSYHTTAHFLRAALEGICFALKNILEIIETSTIPIAQLNVSGGFVHSKIWVQILADITGKKLCLVQTEDASSVGAALLYMKSNKMINEYASLKSQNALISPLAANHTLYKKYYVVFKSLYEPLKNSMHTLNDINKNS